MKYWRGRCFLTVRLLKNHDLLEYYEVQYSLEIESDDKAYNGSTYKSLYNKCKEIIEREKQYSKKFSTVSEELKKKFLVNI